ncbi:molybdopterin-dependent oxidoreductase [Sanguibacter inulinus]|uniref:Molybdopterin-dependent oxidoreductase n=1 Tax=Sanguibacter inulinus TaxID=60922 RepID=A0A853EV19_9MICO|nr:molybdopterin-dependent oxidoreductase [Sanguibacter inulinus]MBF0722058.1 molybdopterin-dependent oxidoreductase [Sanguibacter inulinus]NYS93203.1 molybdopterin-dependent oxidoreductase [Sanguibacter inulinus]
MDDPNFPLWLQATHLINFVLIGILLRSGWEMLTSLPRLWWRNDSKPGTEWLKFTRRELPQEEGVYTSLMDERSASPVFTLPGRKNIGLARHFHGLGVMLWMLNGIVYVALLFGTGLWRRIVPTEWSVFPEAWASLKIYAGLGTPDIEHFQPYDALQMLAYTGVLFVLAPLLIVTGLAMAPAVRSRFPRFVKLLGGHQGARSLHFIAMVLMTLFIVMHVGLVFLVHAEYNLPHMIFGVTDTARYAQAFTIAILTIVVVFAFWIGLSYASLLDRPRTQKILVALTEPARRFGLGWMRPRMQDQTVYTEKDLSEFHWTNGLPPTQDESPEWLALRDGGWSDWRLEIGSTLDGSSVTVSLDDLKALPKTEYIAVHTCMQGWSATSRWTGVRLAEVLDLLGPRPEGARYVMITSHGLAQEMWDHRPREPFYTVLDLKMVAEADTILAYERNDRPLDIHLGAPLRLRVESNHGYKMVKWVRSVEWIRDYADYGDGRGGTREDGAMQAFNGVI